MHRKDALLTKQIPLTQGQVALVDDWRFEELNQWKWYSIWNKHTRSFYAARMEGKRPFRKVVWMHYQIMNTPDGMECDHRNHNTLDDQEHNLRNVTHSQNQMNRGPQSNNRLGEKCIRPKGNGYYVEVMKDRKVVFCKQFHSLDEAIAARDEALKKHHGEFAYLPGKNEYT